MSAIEDKRDDETPPGDVTPRDAIDDDTDKINEKALLRKIDAQLLPAVGILYLLSFLDRSNGKSSIAYCIQKDRSHCFISNC